MALIMIHGLLCCLQSVQNAAARLITGAVVLSIYVLVCTNATLVMRNLVKSKDSHLYQAFRMELSLVPGNPQVAFDLTALKLNYFCKFCSVFNASCC